MPCEVWRGKLEAYVDGELPLPEANALRDHMRGCAACAAAALERVQMKRSVAMAGKCYEPSAGFRAKIATTFCAKAEPRTGWLRKIIIVPALLTLVFALGLTFYVSRARAERQQVFSELADLHVATLASATPVDVISTDRHTVKPWFEGKIPFTFNLPELQGTEFSLVGGRVTYLSQAPGAHLLYRLRKHELSVFIFPDSSAAGTTASGAFQMRSFNFEEWTQNGLRYFVVGDVGTNDLAALTKLLRDAR
ncbi:MAG TPA: zf-HC2 domain-containing protein [Candidatus Sulfotelmatobacter sp.]|nr:zf-HC2 domain-containing protein [Candidatus Sulfotelmatobacter sp.]